MNKVDEMSKMTEKKFYNFVDIENEDRVELVIEGEIVAYKGTINEYIEEDFGSMSTGAKQFVEELNKYQDKNTIKILLNSPGGDVFAAISIYNHLKRTNKNIEVEITGYACSAATIIMMAGDKISMPNNSLVMIHDPMLTLYGTYNSQDLGERGKVLDKVKDVIINSYKSKAKIDDKKLSKLMSSETWMTAQECLEYGFIDEILHNKNVEVIENSTSIFINSISYDREKIKEILNKNAKKIKNVFKIDENNFKKMVKIENKFDKKEELAMNEREEIAKNERERIKQLYKYRDKIEESLINEAIENGWRAKDLTYEAFERDMIIKDKEIFENHLKANIASGVKNIEMDTTQEESNKDMSIQDILDTINGIK